MSHQNDPDYPEWVVNIMNQVRGCTHCGCSVGLVNIIGLGVQAPDRTDSQTLPQHPFFRIHARGRITTRCPRCRKDSAFEMQVDKMPLLSAVESLFDFIESADEPADETVLPSPNFPPPSPPEAPEEAPEVPPEVPSEAPPEDDESHPLPGAEVPGDDEFEFIPNRPSRRPNAPTGMPSQKEVDVFLRTLGRTSFRRSTKSYQQFMRRLGIVLDGYSDNGAETHDE